MVDRFTTSRDLKLHANGQWYRFVDRKHQYFGTDEKQAHFYYWKMRLQESENEFRRPLHLVLDAWIKEKTNEGLAQQTLKDYAWLATTLKSFVGRRTTSRPKERDGVRQAYDYVNKKYGVWRRHNFVIWTRSVYRWAEARDIQIIEKLPTMKIPSMAEKRRDRAKRRGFHLGREVKELIKADEDGLFRCAWFCAYGPKDVTEMSKGDWHDGVFQLNRSKTGISRCAWVPPQHKWCLEIKWGAKRTAQRHWQELCEKAGVPCLGMYAVRRTVRSVLDGQDDGAVRALMGHARLGIDTHYCRMEVGRERMQRLGLHLDQLLEDSS